MYQFFFFLPQIFFLFRSLSSAACISVRESLSFENNYLGEEAKIMLKLQTQKKNVLVKCKVFPSNKSGLVQCNVFCDTKKFPFFHAGFVWMIKLVKKKCFVLSTRFPLSKTALFFAKVAFSVEKKKDWRQKLFLCFV